MTPLEKAVNEADRRDLCAPVGPKHVRFFNADDARAIITAFLEAAAEDEVVLGRLECSLASFIGGNRQPHMSGDPRERLSPLQRRNTSDAAVSAILALKETL
jgi:hypothetical protein